MDPQSGSSHAQLAGFRSLVLAGSVGGGSETTPARPTLGNPLLAPTPTEESAPRVRADKAKMAAVADGDEDEETAGLTLPGVLAIIGQTAGLSVDADQPLMDSGLNSMSAIETRNALECEGGVSLPVTLAFDYPTARLIAASFGGERKRRMSTSKGPPKAVTKPKSEFGFEPDPSAAWDLFPSAEMPAAYRFGMNDGLELHVGHHMYFELDYLGLDLPRFRQAWERAFERHAALRVEVFDDGSSRIHAHMDPSIEVHDLSESSSYYLLVTSY